MRSTLHAHKGYVDHRTVPTVTLPRKTAQLVMMRNVSEDVSARRTIIGMIKASVYLLRNVWIKRKIVTRTRKVLFLATH